jgi:cytochrome oxidase Cu insertion factor (SCO1/SenC/PrrC family)
MNEFNDAPAMQQQARRAAKKVGLYAKKSRTQKDINNRGGFMVIDPNLNIVRAGDRFDMSAQEVIDYCAKLE